MSRRISDEIINLRINVNSDEAQLRVANLEKENLQLSQALSDQKKIMQDLSRQRKKDSKEYREAEAEVRRLTEAIARNEQTIASETQQIDIMNLTMQQLNRRASDLRFTLSHMAPNDPQYRVMQEELSRVNTRMGELRAGSRAVTGTLTNLVDKFNHYSGMAMAVSATLVAVGMSIQKVIDLNNKMADAQTAVAKTTGLTNEEVKELTRSFSEFDTRTKRIDLLKIAEIGGRIGVPKQEIKDFTREVDKAYVALGDSFSGGVEKVAEKIGKIKGLFKETRDLDMATAINQIGSSMNDLGASGAASEENIAEFAMRVGALPDKLKPTVAEAMALGAAFEENGIDAERSATAYSNFVRTAAKESKAFAEVMGITQAEVEKLINQNPVEFFLKFSEGIKGMEATDVAKVLDHLKLNDQYVTAIMGAASENTELFRKSIERSNQSLTEATSLQEEFNKVNNNAAAIYEKVQKKFVGMFSSEAVANTLNWLIEMLGRLLGVVIDNGKEVSTFTNFMIGAVRVLTIFAASIVSVSVATALYNGLIKNSIVQNIALDAIQKGRLATTKALNVVKLAGNAILGAGALLLGKFTALLGMKTVATNLATVAQTRLNMSMSANPIGAILAVVGLLITAYMTYGDEIKKIIGWTKEETEATKAKKSIMEEFDSSFAKGVADKTSQIKNLIFIINNENATLEQRKQAYEKLINIDPAFRGTLDSQYRATNKLASAFSNVISRMQEFAMVQAEIAVKTRALEEHTEKRFKEGMLKAQIKDIDSQIEKERDKYARRSKDGKYILNDKGKKLYDMNPFSNTVSPLIDQKDKLVEEWKEVNKSANEAGKAFNYINNQNISTIKELQKGISIMEAQLRGGKIKGKIITAEQRVKLEQQLDHRKKMLSARIGVNSDNLHSSNSSSNYNIPKEAEAVKGVSTDKTAKKTEKDRQAEKALEDYKKQKDDLLNEAEKYAEKEVDIEFRKQENLLELMKEGLERDKAKIELEGKKKQQELEKQKIPKKDFAKLDAIIAKEVGDEKKKFEAIKESWMEHNRKLTELQLQEKEITKLKLKLVDEKAIEESLKRDEVEFSKKVENLKREENQILAQLTTIEDQKAFLQDKISKKELSEIKTWEQGKAAVQKHFQKESLKEQQKYLRKLIEQLEDLPAATLTDAQTEALERMKNKLAEIGVEISSIQGSSEDSKFSSLSGFGGSTDVFGLSQEQWEAMFENTDRLEVKIQKIGAALSVAKNMLSTYHEYARANQEAEIRRYEVAHERKKKALEAQLAAGLISQQEYKHRTIANENELAMKKYQLELDAAKREKAIKISETIANTAMAIMNLWSGQAKNPILAGIMTGAITAMGAVQVATIARQPLPAPPSVQGAEDGYYPVIRKQDGKLFNARKRQSRSGIYDEPTMLVGEQGKNFPELVVSGRAMKRIDPQIQRQFMNEVARVEGFEKGLYPTPVVPQNDEVMNKIITLLNANIEVLNRLEQNGVRGVFEKSARMGKDLEEMQKEYRRIVDKNKH